MRWINDRRILQYGRSPFEDDLRAVLDDFNVWRDVTRRVAILILLAVLAVVTLACADLRRAAEAREIDSGWDRRVPRLVADFGSTRTRAVD